MSRYSQPESLPALLNSDHDRLCEIVEQTGQLLAKVVLFRVALHRQPGAAILPRVCGMLWRTPARHCGPGRISGGTSVSCNDHHFPSHGGTNASLR
jgi:hypothetical protein